MATAAKTPPSSPLASVRGDQPSPREPWALRAFDAVFRFLASLKLAVISLLSLAAVLAYATFFEKWYGTAAVQEWIYQSPGFAILLAFLGMNILCAALIRFPWTRRQTGFVITHSGLLVLLAGSWMSVKVTLTGQEGMLEGDASSQLVLTDDAAVRVQELDRETGRPTTEYQLPFFPGTFAWEDGRRTDVLTTPEEPFQLVVKKFYPASTPTYRVPVDAPGGDPMIKAALFIKPPQSDREIDIFARFDETGTGDLRWLKADDERLRRDARDLGPAAVTFQFAATPEMVEDFLALPDDPLKQDRIRIHYRDRDGRPRVFDWPESAPLKQPVELPDSDLTATLNTRESVPIGPEVDPDGSLRRRTGEDELHVVFVEVRKAGGPPRSLIASSTMPAAANQVRGGEDLGVRVSYYHPPHVGAQAMQGRSGVIDILGTPDGKLYYRAFSREGLRGKGPFETGRRITLVQGPNQPVAFSFQVDKYLLSGVDEERVDPLELPAGQKDQGVPAALCALTSGGETREFWLRRPGSLEPAFRTIRVGKGAYRLAFDFERKELPFTLKLVDFEVGMDPGTAQPSSYVSEVLLDDPQRGVEGKPVTITMNEPLTWRHYTFYQSNYQRHVDPQTGRPTGRFMSIFQVRYDPPWCWGTVYGGCALVVLGIFVQFYMRAGVFSDGGKKERERAARREAKRQGKPLPRKTKAASRDDDEPL
jgi:hypothetical protein